jgi:adenylyltransferase/sulfurtransferase
MKTLAITVAGAGNTGSHLLPHLARMPQVERITMVDHDVYDEKNLLVQDIDSCDIGKPKVSAQAEKLRRINPRLDVSAMQERIEDSPLGKLRCDLLVSCLDSRAARQYVNQVATRLNMPWIDCGILGSQNLVRVNSYAPGQDAPCLECSWGPDDYSLLEQEYLCGASSGAAFHTMASSALGALAASLMALEIAKLFSGELTVHAASRQILLDANNHILRVSSFRRSPDCRFDHMAWIVSPWRCQPESTSVASALKELGSVQIEGHLFVRKLICPGCKRQEQSLRLNRPLAHCATCGRRMVSIGFGSLECLDADSAGEFLNLTLAQIGLRDGDIINSGKNNHWLMEAA